MTDRIPHDDPSVTAVRAKLVRAGRTSRPKIELPDDETLFPGVDEPVRIVLGGRTCFGRIDRAFGAPEIRALYANKRRAREDDGENALEAWFRDSALDFGRSVHVDVIDPGSNYGIRAPGERAVYTLVDGTPESLADIARDLE